MVGKTGCSEFLGTRRSGKLFFRSLQLGFSVALTSIVFTIFFIFFHEIPVFVVVTKIDRAPQNVLEETVQDLNKMVQKKANKRCVRIHNREQIDIVFQRDPHLEKRLCPVFLVSAVDGTGLDDVYYFLGKLKTRRSWEHKKK